MIHHQMKQREDKRVHDASLQMKMVTLIFVFYSSVNTEPIIPSVQLCKYFLIRLVKPPKKVNIFRVEAVKYSFVFT